MEFNTSLYKEAGLNKNDIARLFDVSRTTVYNWHATTKVHSLIYNKVVSVTKAVQQALSDKKLPVDIKNADERKLEINRIVAEYI